MSKQDKKSKNLNRDMQLAHQIILKRIKMLKELESR